MDTVERSNGPIESAETIERVGVRTPPAPLTPVAGRTRDAVGRAVAWLAPYERCRDYTTPPSMVARMCGVTPRAVQRWLAGTRTPPPAELAMVMQLIRDKAMAGLSIAAELETLAQAAEARAAVAICAAGIVGADGMTRRGHGVRKREVTP